MSDSVVRDVMSLLEELGFGTPGKGIYDPQLMDIRKPPHGILVEQRNTTPVPDALISTDTVYINIQVRGEGKGEVGKSAAYTRAMELYRALRLILDRTIDGTLYLCITPDSAPYEVQDGEHYDYLFGLEVARYYGDEHDDED